MKHNTKKMNTQISKETPVWQLTVGELLDIVNQNKVTEIPSTSGKKYAYGYNGIASELLGGASRATVFRLLRSGRISAAIAISGRRIICDLDVARELLKKPQGGRK